MIVMLGRQYIEGTSSVDIEAKIQKFNQQIENQQIIESNHFSMPLNQIEENWAGRLGKNVSDLVIGFIDGSLRLVTAVFTESS